MSKNRFDLIRDWATERGIFIEGDSKTQIAKTLEELGETSRALLKRDDYEFYDGVGDVVVTLTLLVELYELERLKHKNIVESSHKVNIEECIDMSYKIIANRSGSMQNGTFVKESLYEKAFDDQLQAGKCPECGGFPFCICDEPDALPRL